MRWTDVHPKVAAGGLGGALSVIVIFFLGAFGHITVPPEVAAAIATLFTFGAGYITTGDAGSNIPTSLPEMPPPKP